MNSTLKDLFEKMKAEYIYQKEQQIKTEENLKKSKQELGTKIGEDFINEINKNGKFKKEYDVNINGRIPLKYDYMYQREICEIATNFINQTLEIYREQRMGLYITCDIWTLDNAIILEGPFLKV